MRIDYTAQVCFVRDFECVIDADLEWEDGEPVVVINDVEFEGHSLLRHNDKLMAQLGLRIADQAEDDDFVLERLMADEGASYRSLGANDPDGRFIRTA